MVIIIIIIIIITLFQEGDIYITIVNHDGPQNNRNNIKVSILSYCSDGIIIILIVILVALLCK